MNRRLEAVGLKKNYHNKEVVSDVSITVEKGEVVGLLGPNGAGKTTTFSLILGLVHQDAGQILLGGEDITGLPMYVRARKGLCLLPQESSAFRKLSVEDNLLSIVENMPGGPAKGNGNLRAILNELGLTKLINVKAYTLSGGERRRLEIARALVTEPEFILLDEPFTGIDPLAILDLQEIILTLKERGIGVLITDHSVRETLKITDRAYIIDKGKILAQGTPDQLVSSDEVKKTYLGEEFDIHCGGQDLTFPHHEDEIAQSKGAGFGFARYWMHNGFLNIDNEKMSKSLGNFFTIREVFEKYPPLAVRYFLLSAHYRAPLNYSLETLTQADHTLKRYNDFIQRVTELSKREVPGNDTQNISRLVEEAKQGFDEGLEDDLNISKSLASIADFTKEINILMDKDILSSSGAKLALDFFKNADSVLGVFTFEKDILPEEVENLIEERNRARASKDFNQADMIRQKLLDLGIVLEDTKEGTRWKKIG